jgi:hypothetical protein
MVLAGRGLAGDSNKLLHLLPWPRRLFRVKQGFHWHGIRSCNLGVWRSDFAGVNGFDETFEGWGHEDADLVLRLHHLGIRRKNGFMGTEVFHLWHRENPRDQESINKKRVLERMKTDVVLAEKGLRELDSFFPRQNNFPARTQISPMSIAPSSSPPHPRQPACGRRFPVVPAFAQFRVEVSGVGLTQLPIAVAAFRGDAQAPQKIGAIVRADLERSGMFRPVDTTGIAADENTRPTWPPGGKRARIPWSPAA